MSGPTVDDHGRIWLDGQDIGTYQAWQPASEVTFATGWPPLTEAEQIRARLNKRLRGNKWPNTTKGTP